MDWTNWHETAGCLFPADPKNWLANKGTLWSVMRVPRLNLLSNSSPHLPFHQLTPLKAQETQSHVSACFPHSHGLVISAYFKWGLILVCVIDWSVHLPPAEASQGDNADGLAVRSSNSMSCRWVFHSVATLLHPATVPANRAAAPIRHSFANAMVSLPQLLVPRCGFLSKLLTTGYYKSHR